MAKKRRDKERDSSSVGKVAKVGAAALSVGVGAAVFAKKGYTKKLTSEVAPALLGTTSAIKKDLTKARASRTGLNKTTKMQDLYDVYNNHLKGNKTFKNKLVENKANAKIKLNTSDKRLSQLGQIKDYYQTIFNDVDRELKNATRNIKRENYYYEKIANQYKNKNQKHLKDVTTQVFNAIDEYTVQNKDGSVGFAKFVEGKFDRLNFTKQERDAFLNQILKANENIEEYLSGESFKNASKKAKDDIIINLKRKAVEGKKRSDTLTGKLSDFVNKKFNLDIDLEQTLTGSKALTVNDILELNKNKPGLFDESRLKMNMKNNSGVENSKYATRDVFEELKKFVKENEDFGNVIIDNALRIDENGNVFDASKLRDELSKNYRSFSSSVIGSLFGQTDRRLRNEAPSFAIMHAGKTGKEAAYELGNETTALRNAKVAIGNTRTKNVDLFDLSINSDGELVLGKEALATNGFLDNLSHGKIARLTKNMLGSNIDPLHVNDSSLAQILDIGQSGAPSTLEKIKARFTKGSNPDWMKNIISRSKAFADDSDISIEKRIETIAMEKMVPTADPVLNEKMLNDLKADLSSRLLKDTKEISALLNNYTALHQVDDETIESLLYAANQGIIKDNHSLNILNIISNNNLDNYEMLELLSAKDGKFKNFEKLYNKDLENIINRGLVNTDHILHMQNISQIKPAGFLPEVTNVMEIRDVIKRESIKEVLLREAAVGMPSEKQAIFNRQSIEHLEDILQLEYLTKEQSNNLRYLAN